MNFRLQKGERPRMNIEDLGNYSEKNRATVFETAGHKKRNSEIIILPLFTKYTRFQHLRLWSRNRKQLFYYNIIQQNLLRLKRSIILVPSLSHLFHFFLVRIITYKSKTIIFSIQSQIIITSFSKK